MNNKPFEGEIPSTTKILINQVRKAGRWNQAKAINALLATIATDIPAVRELALCGTPVRDGLGNVQKTRVWNGIPFRAPRYKCNLPYCTRCSPRSRQQEAQRIWKKIKETTTPTAESTSWVTIRGESLPLGSNFSFAKLRMAQKLRRVFRDHLPDCKLAAQFSISVRPDWTGMLHIHGAVIHKDCSRSVLTKVLRQHFGKGKTVRVQKPRSSNIDKEWLEPGDIRKASGSGRYACDVRLEGIRMYGDDLAHALLGHIVSWESIRGRKREGLRLEIGLNRRRTHSHKHSSIEIIRRLVKRHSSGGTLHRNSDVDFDHLKHACIGRLQRAAYT